MKKTLLLFFICLFFAAFNSAFAATIVDSSMDSAQKMFILSADENIRNIKVRKIILNNPKRVIFDIENLVFFNNKAMIEPPNSLIKSVKVAQFSSQPHIVRIVFVGDEKALDKIRISTVRNFIVFNMGEISKSLCGATIYAEKEPEPKKVDYFSYYENLNVVLSNNLPKKTPVIKDTPKISSASNIHKPNSNGANVWHEIKMVDFPARYNIFNIEAFDKGIKIQGLGTAGVTSPVYSGDKFSIDLPDTAFQGGKVPLDLQLSSSDKVHFSVPSKNIVRINITSPNFKDYNAIVSPDMMTLSLQKTKDLSPLDFPFVQETLIDKVQALPQGRQVTKLVVRAKTPIAHSIIRNPEELILNFYNLNTCTAKPEVQLLQSKGIVLNSKNPLPVKPVAPVKLNYSEFMKTIVPTKQFRSVAVSPLGNNKKGTQWKIPVKSSAIVSTQLSPDGKELDVILKDPMYQTKDIIIKSGSTVMIDAGHGGADAGAAREGIFEKDINLDIAKELKKYLETKGVKVLMTRDMDERLALSERVAKANSATPDLFVSVHVNSARNSDVYGVETHWYKSNSQILAKIVHNNISLGLDSFDRGIIQSQFYVINHTTMPAVLVEVGFISNCKERCDIMRKQRKVMTAKSIGNGILLYLAMDYENEGKIKANAK